MTAVNELLVERDEIIANLEAVKKAIFDSTALDAEHVALHSEMAVVTEIIQKCVYENSHVAQSQDEYRQRYDGPIKRFEAVKRRFEEVDQLRQEKKARRDMVEAFLGTLKTQVKIIIEFDEVLWFSLVDCVTVYSEDVRFRFMDGTTIKT